jgi:low affinity Fe/Cu permease
MDRRANNANRREVAKVVAGSGRKQTQGDGFGKFANATSSWLGSKWAFVGAIVVIVVWTLTGPVFYYSDTWQLVINTGTTIITFLMVFIIQNTQNRDARAINLKLDELIHAIDNAKNQMMDIEKLSDEELDTIHEKYTQMRAECDQEEHQAKAQQLDSAPVGQSTNGVDGEAEGSA